MGIRRYMMEIRKQPTNVIKEGEKTVLIPIVKGENLIFDAFIRDILCLPEKTKVFHCNTSKIIPPTEFIGGSETRPSGDTCSMFFRLKIIGRTADYFFWDGIVPNRLHILKEEPSNCFNDFEDVINRDVVNRMTQLPNKDFILITGRANHRIVLVEKIRKVLPDWREF